MKICDCDVFKRMCLPVAKLGNDVDMQFKEESVKIFTMNQAHTCQAAVMFNKDMFEDLVNLDAKVSNAHFLLFLKALPKTGEATLTLLESQLILATAKKTLTLPLLVKSPSLYKDPTWPVACSLEIDPSTLESSVKELESTETELIRFVVQDKKMYLKTHESNIVQCDLEIGVAEIDCEVRISGSLVLPMIVKAEKLLLSFGDDTPLTIEAHDKRAKFIGVIAPRVGD